MIIAVLIGLLIDFVEVDPMKAVIYAAVMNGVVAAPLILLIALIARNKKIMHQYTSGWISNLFVWLTPIVMGLASFAMLTTAIHSIV